ncbi:MAG TPA: hypothetical protein VK586_25230, partial [Streptosporangiaceae bacterium]|nr:hypothetical protein [Streptosporangiaceae bacterium]
MLIAPSAAVIPPGHTVSPAQALADALDRPVLAPNSGYIVGRDGSVNAVRRPAPDAIAFGQGWREGNWVAVFPRAQHRAPVELPFNLADAISEARRHPDLRWTLEIIGRAGLVPPPAHDVHFPVQTPDSAIDEWRRGIEATHRLAAAARELLPEPESGAAESDDLRAELDRADHAVRAVPRPPDLLPATAQERAPVWRDLARFQAGAADLGRAVAAVLALALEGWASRLLAVGNLPGTVRGLLPRTREQEPELATALSRLQEAVGAVPGAPPQLPATAAEVSAAVQAIARADAQERDISRALADVLTLLTEGWHSRATDAENLASAARELLPFTAADRADLERRLDTAHDELPDDPPELPLGWRDPDAADWQARMDYARRALAPVIALEEASRAVLAVAAAGSGLQSRVAAAPDLATGARTMLPYTGERQPDLTARLDEADRQLRAATPTWWRANGAGLTTVADVQAARRGLAGDEAARVKAAAVRFEDVVAEVAAAANQTGRRLLRLRSTADQQLPLFSHEQRRPLMLALRAAPIFDNWPGLPRVPAAEMPGAAAAMAAAAQRLADPPPSVERAETAIRNVLAAAIEEWKTRLAALRTLGDRVRELLPEPGEPGHHFTLVLQNVAEFVIASARQVAAAQVGTAAQLDAAADNLAQLTFELDAEAYLKNAIAVVIDNPMRAAEVVAGLNQEADRLLPYVDEELRDVLRAAQAELAPVLPVPPPVASRPLAELDLALSQAIGRLQQLRTATPSLRAAVAALLEAGWDPRVAAVRDMAGQAHDLLEQARGRLPGERQQALAAALEAAAAALPGQPPKLPDSPATRAARVLGYLSGDPAAHLTAADQGELARQLLTGQASPSERALVLVVLAAADDSELEEIFADGEMLDLLQAQIRGDDPLRALLDHLLATRFQPGAGGAGLVVAKRQPAQPFSPGLIDGRLSSLSIAEELTDEQAARAAAVISPQADDSLRAALADRWSRPDASLRAALTPLPPVQRARAAWWVARVRARAGWADRAVAYLSGDRAAPLGHEERRDLVVGLMNGLATPDERWLALQLLRTADDRDLAAMLAGGVLLTLLDRTILRGDPLHDALEAFWTERFDMGWVGAAHPWPEARGLPRTERTFSPRLIGGAALARVDVTAELTPEQVTLVAQAIRGRYDWAARLVGLPPVEQVRAARWLTRLRAAVLMQAAPGSAQVLANLDNLLQDLHAETARRGLDTGRLRLLSARPPARQAPALRAVRGPVTAAEIAAVVAQLNELPAAAPGGRRVKVFANTPAEEIEPLLSESGAGAVAVRAAPGGSAELDTVRQALAAVTNAESAIGDVLTEVNSVAGAQVTTAGVRDRAARALLSHSGAQEGALGDALDNAEHALSTLSELPHQPLPTGEAIDVARQRLTRLSALEEAIGHVRTAATAALDELRPQVEAADRLARGARALGPHTGRRQDDLLGAELPAATARLREITPSWWTANGAALSTMAQVEAAVPALTAGPAELQDAAREVERVVSDVLTAAASGWEQTAGDLREAASGLGDLLPHTGEQQPDLEGAVREALRRVDADPRAMAGPPPADQRSVPGMEAAITAMALVTDLEAAIRGVADAASDTARQQARVLMGLPDEVRGLLPLIRRPDRLRAGLSAADGAVTGLLRPPGQPLTTAGAIDAARRALSSVAGLRGFVEAVLTEATEGLPDRIAAARALFRGMGTDLPIPSQQREDLAALERSLRERRGVAEASPDITTAVAVVRRGLVALTDLETAASRVLDQLAWSRRAHAAVDLARAVPGLLAAVTGPDADPVAGLDPGIAAVQTALGGLPQGRPATAAEATEFGQRVSVVTAQVTALETHTRQMLDAATARLDDLRREAEVAEVVAGAARELLPRVDGGQAGLTGRLDRAVRRLRRVRTGRWRAAGAELTTAAEVQAAAAELAGAPERVLQATRDLGDVVA